MGLFRSCLYLSVFYMLQGSNASLVQLAHNGYEDIIVAINPLVLEDEKLIQQIKDMVTTASTYLFEATEKRFFFRKVSILIPENWTDNPQYRRPRHESYQHADILVAPPTHPGRDEPYTRHFKDCGEKGEFIHLTPDFVLGKKTAEYGPSGKVLVHEWAHLRWGVFDEYNEDEPFYAATSTKVEATRCSTGITGQNRVLHCVGGSCVTKRCRVDPQTKLYEKDCQFFPNKVQTEKASIMFMQNIDSISEFCTAKNHNQEAPNLQNKKCNFRSTWEVISNSEDFQKTAPMIVSPPATAFSLLKISQRIVCLVLDKSENMAIHNRLHRMNQAAKYFLLQTIENGSWVGVVAFDSMAHIKSKLIQITSSNERRKLIESLPTEASGGISICSGIKSAFQVLRERFSQIDGAEIVLLVAGKDSTVRNCMDEVIQSGVIIHLIALGPDAEGAVTEMCTKTGGSHQFASDNAQNSGLVHAFGALAAGNTDLSQQAFQRESKGLALTSDPWMNGTVVIDSTVGKETFFLVTWNQRVPRISLWDPNGTLVGKFTVDINSKMAHLTIPGIAKVGVWTYSLQAKATPEVLTMTVTSHMSSSAPPITVSAKMKKERSSFPSPIVVYAEVQQGLLPLLGANVTAFIESAHGQVEVLELLDNGAGADSFKNDGVYSRYFTAYKENGRYSLKIRAHGEANSVTRSSRHPLNRALYTPAWVVDGKIEGRLPRSAGNEATQTTLESFSRTVSGGVFVVSNVPKVSSLDMYPPSQITDLAAQPDGDQITLTWTAPGDDFDSGKVEQYIIRISGSLLDLRDNFDNALQVNTTELLPSEANAKETFAFKPGNAADENATYIYIAMQSVDKSNLTSKVSNVAQVPLFVPQADAVPDDSHHNTKLSISTLVLSGIGSVAVATIILSTTIHILKKKKHASESETEF
ncbi:calcium-activated chloride channel regulator 4-like [Tenrec ecaudatus]|uniref:calcium-activated chloride channel regulator 4-like n=1 Tax=Tenrec ecaudatus TaxID=94439 RepID=UPI003F5AB320